MATMQTETPMYIGYEIGLGQFRDEEGNQVSAETVQELFDANILDATALVYRLIRDFDWDHEKLVAYYYGTAEDSSASYTREFDQQ